MLDSNNPKYLVRKNELLKFIIELSIKGLREKNIPSKVNDLKRIYLSSDCKDRVFRHMSSDIYETLMRIRLGENGESRLECLQINIFAIRNFCLINRNKNSELLYSIDKLYDHISIEINRLNYINAQISDTINSALNKKDDNDNASVLQMLTIRLRDVQESTKKAVDEAKSMKGQIVTILSIFCSVVVAFVSGITFSTSVLENIDKPSPYRLFTCILLIGFVFITLLYMMFYFVNSIVNRSEYNKHRKDVILKVSIPYFIAIVLIIIMLGTIAFFWYNGYIESRDIRILGNISTYSDIR